jgi:hypothetical protein
MPRQLALLLCVIVIGVLFRFDPRKRSELSAELWIPTIWMLIIGSRMVTQWFNGIGGGSAESYADGSPMDRNIFLSLFVIALIILIKRRFNFQKLVRNNIWLIAFLAYAFISITWSDFAIVSLKRYTKEIGNILMALIVLTERSPLEALRTLLKRAGYILIPLSIVLYKYFSELGRGYGRWTGELYVIGVTNNKNSLGVLCALSAIGLFAVLIAMWRAENLWDNKKILLARAGALALTIWLLMMARSATSIGCSTVAAVILFAVGIKNVRRNLKVYVLLVVVAVAAVYLSGSLVSAAAGSLGRDDTLTGRTEIWAQVIKMTKNPLMGGGYSSFWLGDRMEKLWSMYAWHPTEAHDGYVETYLDLGLIGDGLLAGVILAAFGSIFKQVKTDFEFSVLRLALLVFAVLYNITESAFRPGHLMYFIFMAVVINLPRPVKNKNQQKQVFDSTAALSEHDVATNVPPELSPAPLGRTIDSQEYLQPRKD